MRIKEIKVSLCVVGTSLLLGTVLGLYHSELERKRWLVALPFLSVLVHILPLFTPFIISVTSTKRKRIKAAVYIISALMGLAEGFIYYYEPVKRVWGIGLIGVYLLLSVFECLLFFIKWYMRYSKRKAMKTVPVIKRRFGNEIKLPLVSVATESKHLRTKTDFVINGTVYIRKGETVELLKTIGSYYSVRNASGIEYIVPKTNFF
ncbi:hypothetical protein NECID01_0831 [Nematocida sp. AWRm77]|nr:hypothetical protein NECID01_0831 [Nematocida sp. AWRm77]